MEAVFLHIGAPKTGSTALQAFLTANRRELSRQGWCYPDVSLRGFGHHDLAFLSGGGYPDWATPQQRSLADLIAELRAIAKDESRLVISSENFYLLGKPESTARMLEGAGIPLDRVTILVYVRRQDEAHVSWYNQIVKAQGFAGSIDDSIARTRDLWDYQKNLGGWARCFGERNVAVRPYEVSRLVGGEICRDFLEVAGISDRNFVWLDAPVNTRLNRDLLEFQRLLNRLPLSARTKRRFHKDLMALSAVGEAEAIFDDTPVLSAEQRRQVLSIYLDGNASVARTFLKQEQLFENGESADLGDAKPRQGLTARKLARIAAWLLGARGRRAKLARGNAQQSSG